MFRLPLSNLLQCRDRSHSRLKAHTPASRFDSVSSAFTRRLSFKGLTRALYSQGNVCWPVPSATTLRRSRKCDQGLAFNHHLSSNRAIRAEQNPALFWNELFDRDGRAHGITSSDRRPEP